jgi:hypothetical protein
MADTSHSALENPDVRHEPTDVQPRVVGWMIAGTTVLVIVSLVACWLLMRAMDAREQREKSSTLPLAAQERGRVADMPATESLRARFNGEPPLEGLLEGRAAESAREQAAAEERRLESYGWVDRSKGVVHIPLAKAKELALKDRQKYLPTRKPKGEKP